MFQNPVYETTITLIPKTRQRLDPKIEKIWPISLMNIGAKNTQTMQTELNNM